MGQTCKKSQCNLLIADRYIAEHCDIPIFQPRDLLISKIRIHQSIHRHNTDISEYFQFCCSLLCLGVVAVNARRGYKRCRLTGRVKVDVKAQSQSKLYNRAEESSWQSHWWDREERKKDWKIKRQAFVSVYPAHCTYNMLHMSCWWIGKKMKYWQLRCWSSLHPHYSSS